MAVEDEIQFDDAKSPVRAVSSTTRDFVVSHASSKTEWVLSDMFGAAVSWVSILKHAVPGLREWFDVSSKTMKLFESVNDALHDGIVVRQGFLMLKVAAAPGSGSASGGGLPIRRRSSGLSLVKDFVASASSSSGVGPEWRKVWVVLTDSRLFWGASRSAKASQELSFTPFSVVRIAPRGEEKIPFVLSVRSVGEDPVEGATPTPEVRFHCATAKDFQEWTAALGVAVSRAKERATQERVVVGAALHTETRNGHADSALVQEVWRSADPVAASAVGTAQLAAKQGKKFDASAFKAAFAERDKVTKANWS